MEDSRTKTAAVPSSWACPTEEDDRMWQAMTRDEQLDALRQLAKRRETTTASTLSTEEIRKRAHELSQARRAAKNA